jgi:thiamine monophosphate synthase
VPFNDWIRDNIKEVKPLYDICKQYDIKFVIDGQDRVNGVPFKILFEDE